MLIGTHTWGLGLGRSYQGLGLRTWPQRHVLSNTPMRTGELNVFRLLIREPECTYLPYGMDNTECDY